MRRLRGDFWTQLGDEFPYPASAVTSYTYATEPAIAIDASDVLYVAYPGAVAVKPALVRYAAGTWSYYIGNALPWFTDPQVRMRCCHPPLLAIAGRPQA